jgi:hypothetical protein
VDVLAINLTPVTEVLQGIVTVMPELVNFVVSILPVIIVVILISFIAAFFDRIVAMIGKI